MAVIAYTLASLEPQVWGNNAAIYTWAAMATGDTGAPLQGPGFTDASYQVGGTFGGATVVIEGSNDGTTYGTLVDPFNVALSWTAANGPTQVLPICRYIRPRISGGSGAAITVTAIHCNHANN
jgi:hypothetical protein